MKNYITTLLEEKNIDLEDTFVIDLPTFAHVYTYEQFIDDLVELTKGDTKTTEKIRQTFVKIDFMNGDVTHYIKHLATGMVKAYGGAQ